MRNTVLQFLTLAGLELGGNFAAVGAVNRIPDLAFLPSIGFTLEAFEYEL